MGVIKKTYNFTWLACFACTKWLDLVDRKYGFVDTGVPAVGALCWVR